MAGSICREFGIRIRSRPTERHLKANVGEGPVILVKTEDGTPFPLLPAAQAEYNERPRRAGPSDSHRQPIAWSAAFGAVSLSQRSPLLSIVYDHHVDPWMPRTNAYQTPARPAQERRYRDRAKARTTHRQQARPRSIPSSPQLLAPGPERFAAEWTSTHLYSARKEREPRSGIKREPGRATQLSS